MNILKLLRQEQGSEVLEIGIVLPVITCIIILCFTFQTFAFGKATAELAAREAARTYAVYINKDTDEATVIDKAKNAAMNNLQGVFPKGDQYCSPNDIKIENCSLSAEGVPIPDPGGEYCLATVKAGVPIAAPWIRRLLGSSATDPTWDDPLGQKVNSEYVFPVSGHAVFKKEPKIEVGVAP